MMDFLGVKMCMLSPLCVVCLARRNSVAHGGPGRSGGGGQMSAEEWGHSGCQGSGEAALFYASTLVHPVFPSVLPF